MCLTCLISRMSQRGSLKKSFRRVPSTDAYSFDVDEEDLTFVINPIRNGYNLGRACVLRAETSDSFYQWVSCIEAQVNMARIEFRRRQNQTVFKKYQVKLRALYESNLVKFVMAATISAAFITSLLDAEFAPEDNTELREAINALETSFTVFFTVDLLTNMVSPAALARGL